MARKTAFHTVVSEGRDKGKMYLITEMPVAQIEAWAMRVLLALMASNIQIPDGFADLGTAALAELGLKSLTGLKWETAAPLLNEMLSCVQIVPDPRKTHVARPLLESQDDIEEITTLLEIRMEVWKLHTGFLKAAAPSLIGKVKAAAALKPNIRTSPR